jgi:nicotinamidase-related amidase
MPTIRILPMTKPIRETPALLIIDMVKDNLDPANHFPITSLARRIIEPINRLTAVFHEQGWPVIFSTDDYHQEDFIFSERMPPHSISGTKGAEIIDELDRREDDLWLPKPRFSAFFGTDLDRRMRKMGVTLCAVTGIATHFCVITTAMDALCHDFKAVLVEDGTTAFSEKIHDQTLAIYHHNPLYPLFKVASSQTLLADLGVSPIQPD